MKKSDLKGFLDITKTAENSFRCAHCNIVCTSCQKLNGDQNVYCVDCAETKCAFIPNNFTHDEQSSRMSSKLQEIEKLCYCILYNKISRKKNAKGETSLHKACKSKDWYKVCALITAGALVNEKDNAGWTPLHEAVHVGDVRIAEELLFAGSYVNAPGHLYVTPLHKAIAGNNGEMVKLLLRHGADVNIRNFEGFTALDMNKDILHIDENDRVVQKCPQTIYDNPQMKCTVLLLNCDDKLKQIEPSIRQLTWLTLIQNLKPDVTHVVVPNSIVDITNVTILLAMLHQLPVVTYNWLEDCIKYKEMVPLQQYYITGNNMFRTDVMRDVEENRQKLSPRLFDGINFYLSGYNELLSNFEVKIGNSTLTQSEIQQIIVEGGGSLLTREPHIRNIHDIRYPWHAPVASELEQCCHYILYSRPLSLKYNMKELRHMPGTWLIECIWQYKLIPTKEIKLNPGY